MSDPVTDLRNLVRGLHASDPHADKNKRIILSEGTLDDIRLEMAARGTPPPTFHVGADIGRYGGIEIQASAAVEDGKVFIVDMDRLNMGVSGSVEMDLGSISPDAVRALLGHGARPPKQERTVDDFRADAIKRFELVQGDFARPQCKECFSYDVHFQVMREMDRTTYEASCRQCDMAEVVELNGVGGEKRTVTSGNKEKGNCARCGVEMRTTLLTRVAHRSRDEVTTMLDLCEGCSKLTLCVASHSGVHEHVIPYDSPNHTPPKSAVGPLPEGEKGGWCLACNTSMYWIWTFGCTGAWVELTWPILADMWEREGG